MIAALGKLYLRYWEFQMYSICEGSSPTRSSATALTICSAAPANPQKVPSPTPCKPVSVVTLTVSHFDTSHVSIFSIFNSRTLQVDASNQPEHISLCQFQAAISMTPRCGACGLPIAVTRTPYRRMPT